MVNGEQLKERGIQLSLFSAEFRNSGWREKAMAMLEKYIEINTDKLWQAEDLREWAYRRGLEKPPSERAWGSIMVQAKREGLIEFIGHQNVDNPNAHCTPAGVWRAKD